MSGVWTASTRGIIGFRLLTVCVLAVSFTLIAAPASASIITFEIGGADFSADPGGGGSLGGTGADLPNKVFTVVISDEAAGLVQNEIRITITFLDLGLAIDKASTLHLNVKPDSLVKAKNSDPDTLAVNRDSDGTSAGDTDLDPLGIFSTFGQRRDGFTDDGAGKFDLRTTFNQNDFNPGDSLAFDLLLLGGHAAGTLNANSFLTQSEPTSAALSTYATIHLNITGNGNSGDYATTNDPNGPGVLTVVPEPGSMIVWGVGMFCVVPGLRRLRRRKAELRSTPS